MSCDAKLNDNEVYQKNVKIGEQISNLLKSDNIPWKSLSKQKKFCLSLFGAQKPTKDVENTEPRLWQEQLLYIIKDNPMNDGKIIWIIGQEGNEGKYWFESYIRSLYGSYLVAHFDIINKIAVFLHIMSRCALETTDIFNAVCHLKSVVIHFWKWSKTETRQHQSFMVHF